MPVIFECQGQQLLGVIHQCDNMTPTGVVVIVGGPQHRTGSHRQFVLLARHLAERQIASMRFDARGMGDSEGESRCFYEMDDDIRAAIDCFLATCPTLKQVVLWGLCDAASAALFYGYQDRRVKGLILLNPWVFTQQGAAKTYLKHYYLQRLASREFWKKILLFKFDYRNSVGSFLNFLRLARSVGQPAAKIADDLPLPIRMRECLRRFAYPVLLILSGRDLTASEFKETVKADAEWRALLNGSLVSRQDFEAADHTFSSSLWRNQVAEWTSEWIKNHG
ncbi:MAG: hydrolase 1, exosortase A system-associated [Methylococcales bacterium]|nr:hydrolase 1, exosortase A system-associated [Methylococcales bacterium]